ncbi:polysaccharide deacetylase family protein [Sulfurospirillum arcachonense]|uniref:polysaccharide deacetylase family protein n=1 Tax=Sulfurospirillum arcachonense TaxID=57666 RepID=UPI00046A0ACB|nr:polysaccharide deacetylase family protein [Sulfurospirillum arcachonense]
MRFIFLFLFISITLWSFETDTTKLKNYTIIDKDFIIAQVPFKAIRSWKQGGDNYFLILNKDKFTTHIVKTLPKHEENIVTNFSILKSQLLTLPHALHYFGIKEPKNDKIFLTIDMCPSEKSGYEKVLFEFIKNAKSTANIAITGKWMLEHQKDFDELKTSGLDIRWINHSFSHFYDKNSKDLATNFMRRNPENFENEVIKTEKLLLVNKQIPTPFFRFPGLVSSKELIDKLLNKFNLLPLSTNNWLNITNKTIQKGDIVLLHGNLNEHRGIVRFFDQNHIGQHFSPIEDIF